MAEDLSFMPPPMQEEFRAAAQWLGDAMTAKKISDEEAIVAYRHYKQAVCGDNNTPAPSAIWFRAKRKWDEWTSMKGMPRLDAARGYIETINRLKAAHP
ncbi:hypothetical protein PAPYR_375 [Paratrimastix pyriformis]|uniref:Acyl-CoA-binding protein n=1 Tax=Paratrimastix pyriformis TaxID=342808 RepID=A0ABQ8UVK1_9EUKA|nr:hypothetical protein PAPYR_375 [Paratrimastix pyriformis]